MGTNFYAHIIPTKERKNKIKNLIDSDKFNLITEEVEKTYGDFKAYEMDETPSGIIHLGKRSAGWKFLWNPNIYLIRNGHTEVIEETKDYKRYHWVEEPSTAYYLYPLTKEGIKAFIDRRDVKVFDEYGEEQNKDDFFKEALEWTTWNEKEAWDSASYEKEYPNEKKYIINNEYTKMLEKEGFKFISITQSDFYSDGLRFATTTEFS